MGHLLDRDTSQIEFYRRVFDEARDEANPVLERVRFLGILGTSADDCIASGDRVPPALVKLVSQAQSYLRDELQPALAARGIHILHYADLAPHERIEVDNHFTGSIFPALLPLGFDAAKPFPHIAGRGLVLAVVGHLEGDEKFGCVEIPRSLPSFISVAHGDRAAFVWLHEVVAANLAALFPGLAAVAAYPFRIVRDTRIAATPREGGSLRDAIEAGVLRREFGDVRALIVDEAMPPRLVALLGTRFGIDSREIGVSRDLVDLATLGELCRIDAPDLLDTPLAPRVRPRIFFEELREHDILLHHPFDSFDTVIDFIDQAARDPDVLSISTTLYRAGKNSPIVRSLVDAQRAGKQVRVIIELRARMDEAHNLAWGYALEQSGAHVVYGTVAFKVHAKTTLIVRRERQGLRRYVHLSSGNYNPATASLYTDVGLLTSREDVCADAALLFNAMSGFGFPSEFRSLLVAPVTLRKRVMELIAREAEWAARGYPAHMILKMNALADPQIIDGLYRASQSGVRVDLIVRGICLLQPGVSGLSHNIYVRSIVGRLLEHSRAWYFRNGGDDDVYVGSADLMPRNLDGRIEVMVPIEDPALKRRVRNEILGTYLADNVKARALCPDGRYVRVPRDHSHSPINSQECFQ